MKLVGLDINGFKSFADKTKFKFDGGVTGIVGPNGCGKSNVIDAIRWVLGEQKTRNLRSDKMEDVIFSGTERRKKANVADVTITFENTKNILPTEYTSIAITRRLYRDGDSEYYLNNVPCRLKDINTLLLDTGVGADSYSIIALSMVEDLLKDKAGSRRLLFEEAAGISRYKTRKKETLDRLKDVDNSLERLEDVIFEVEKSYKLLEKQALRAEQYFVLKKEYKKTSAQYAFLKIQKYTEEQVKLGEQDVQLENKITATNARIAKHEARIADLQLDLTNGEKSLTEEQRKFNVIQEQIQARENEKKLRAERLKYLDKRYSDIENLILQGTQQIKICQTQLNLLEIQIDSANEEYDKNEFLLNEIEQEVDELKQATHNRRLQLEEQTRTVQAKERMLQNANREVEHRQVEIRSLSAELERNTRDRNIRNDEWASFNQKIEPLVQEIQKLKDEIANAEILKSEIETQLAQEKTNQNQITESLINLKRTLDSQNNEYRLLKNLVDSLDGYPESVIYLKKNVASMKELPLVSDLIYCEPEYKVALESYLESYMNYYVAGTRKEAISAIQILEQNNKGRVNFLILDELKQYADQKRNNTLQHTALDIPGVVPVLNLIDCPDQYKAVIEILLGNAYIWSGEVFPDFEIPNGEAILQKDGSYISKRFAMSGGSVGVFEGKRLGRVQNLERLGKAIVTQKDEIEQLEIQQKECKQRIEDYKSKHPQSQIDTLNKELVRKNQELAALKARDDESKRASRHLEQRANEIQTKIETLQNEIKKQQPNIDFLSDELNELTQQLKTLQKEYNSKSENLDALNKNLNQNQLTFLQIQNKIENLKKDFRSYLEQIKTIQINEGKLREELEQNIFDKTQLISNNDGDDTQIVQLYEQKNDQAQRLNLIEQQVAGVKTTISQNESHIRDERKQKEDLLNDKNKVFQRDVELKSNITSIAERLNVEWGINQDELIADNYFEEEELQNIKLTELEKKLSGLRDKYNKFGEVNTTAIESYQETKQRYDFMVSQKEDLLKSKANLLETIEEIDGAARTQFMTAFNQIREHFIRVFRSLFQEHDTCDLVLVNPNDPLESPIDILAKPKGKRPQTINALSGGEKTLTAISLLFAIYLIKPAPFCIFDEVDAPLDDANIDKFNNIIEEFSKESQFIIVTHNKRTMTRTQMMYGVTMEETGISRVLPVDWTSLNLN